MAKAEVQLIGVLPGASHLREALGRFASGRCTVTGFDDALLKLGANYLPEDGDASYLPFADLIVRLLACCEIEAIRLATHGHLSAAIGLACRALPSESPFSDAARFTGTHTRIEQALRDLRHWGIDSDSLQVTARSGPGHEQRRLQSLAEVEVEVTTTLGRIGRELLSDQIGRLLPANPVHPLPFKRVILLSGSEPPPRYLKVIRWLSDHGVPVVILAPWLKNSQQLVDNLQAMSGSLEVPVSEPAESIWVHSLFGKEAVLDEAPEVGIVSTGDRLSECEWAIREAMELNSTGLRYDAMGVFTRDPERYGPLLRSSAQRLGIPVSVSVAAPLLTNGFASFLLRLLTALSDDSPRGLIPLIGSSYSGLSRDEQIHIREKIRELRVARTWSWEALRDWLLSWEPSSATLSGAVTWKVELGIAQGSMAEWHGRLQSLIESAALNTRVGAPESPTRDSDLRAMAALLRATADSASVEEAHGGIQRNFAEFSRRCASLWESEVMVTVSETGGIRMCTQADSLPELDVLFVVGMLEGSMPRRRREDSILRDTDRALLNQHLGLTPPLPDSFAVARKERDIFLTLCASASKCLVFSYPRTDEESDNVPAFYLSELERCLEGRIQKADRPVGEFVPVMDECRAFSDGRLRAALDLPEVLLSPQGLTEHDAIGLVTPDFELPIEIDELGKALTCSFQSAFRFRLRLFDREHQDPASRLTGIPQKALLAGAKSPNEARTALESAITDLLESSRAESENWEIALIESAASRLVNEWIQREFAARELWARDEADAAYNFKLDERLKHEMKISGKTVRFSARIPAMYRIGDLSVIQLFRRSAPDKSPFEDNSKVSDWIRFGLLLLSQHGRAKGVALEVDGYNGKRSLLVAPSESSSFLRSDQAEGLRRIGVADSIPSLAEQVKSAVRQAVDQLSEGSIRPTPSEACKFCAYGDLCRFSAENASYGLQPGSVEGQGT